MKTFIIERTDLKAKTRTFLRELQKSFNLGVNEVWGDIDKCYSTVKDAIHVFNARADNWKGAERNRPEKLIFGRGGNHIWITTENNKGIIDRVAIIK